MKLIILIFGFVFIAISINCQSNNNDNPPGTIKLPNNLFVDKTELSNTAYREFVYWTKQTFGNDSKEFKAAEIDSTIISNDYYKNPRFNKYPLIGVSYEQAIAYCNWRSDRVYEKKLIRSGIIKINRKQNKDYYFSIDNVLNGKYKIDRPKDIDKISIPQYRLPTIKEWEYASSGGLDIIKHPYGVDSVIIVKKQISSRDLTGLVDVNTNEKINSNGFGLCNMIGNVAEMVNEKGTAKGCAWTNKIDDCVIEDNITYTKPETWLGFRCVCEYRLKK